MSALLSVIYYTQYQERYESTDIDLVYTQARGFHLSVPVSVVTAGQSTGNEFIQRVPSKNGKRVVCTTASIISLNAKQEFAYNECNMQTTRCNRSVL